MLYMLQGFSVRMRTFLCLFLVGLFSVSAFASEAGRGATADLEKDYLQSIIDHHFSALRMTELAAGTLEQAPTGDISADDRVPQTPGFPATEPRASLEEIKSLARRNNRVQREEILTAQRFLRDWYGITHVPQVPAAARADIERLTTVSAEEFDKLFLQMFPRHHYQAAVSSLECLVGRELQHADLRRYCRSIVDAQVIDIDEMRHLACRHFDLCDLQPQTPMMNEETMPGSPAATEKSDTTAQIATKDSTR